MALLHLIFPGVIRYPGDVSAHARIFVYLAQTWLLRLHLSWRYIFSGWYWCAYTINYLFSIDITNSA